MFLNIQKYLKTCMNIRNIYEHSETFINSEITTEKLLPTSSPRIEQLSRMPLAIVVQIHVDPAMQLQTSQIKSYLVNDRDQVQKCAQSPAMSPGSAEALSGNTGVGLDVFDKVFAVEGAPWPPLSIPYHPMMPSWGGLSRGGGCAACTFVRKGTPCASWLMGLVAQRGGITCNIFANVEDTEKTILIEFNLAPHRLCLPQNCTKWHKSGIIRKKKFSLCRGTGNIGSGWDYL